MSLYFLRAAAAGKNAAAASETAWLLVDGSFCPSASYNTARAAAQQAQISHFNAMEALAAADNEEGKKDESPRRVAGEAARAIFHARTAKALAHQQACRRRPCHDTAVAYGVASARKYLKNLFIYWNL